MKNKGVARDLVSILKEANQVVPEWLEQMGNQAAWEKGSGRSTRGGRGGRGGGGGSFRSDRFTDFRRGASPPRFGGAPTRQAPPSTNHAAPAPAPSANHANIFRESGDPRDRSNWWE